MSVINGAAEMYGCTAVITKCGEAVNAPSDPELVRIICEAAEHIEGVRLTCDTAVVSGSGDACRFMKQVQDNGGKAAYFALGTMASGYHTAALISTKTACP